MSEHLTHIGLAMIGLSIMAGLPGWFVIRWLGLSTGWRGGDWAVGVLVGLLILPLIYNWIGIVGPLSPALRVILWGGLTLGAAWLAHGSQVAPAPFPTRNSMIVIWLIGIIAAILTLIPLALHNQEVGGRYVHIMAGDWNKHIPVAAVTTYDDKLPPHNPFLSTETDLRYYYFAYVPSGTVARILGLSPTSALVGMAVLLALCFPWLVYGYGRAVNLTARGASMAAVLIVLISGLDILYVLLSRHDTGFWPEHIDFWANHDLRRINSLTNMLIWTPQHTLALAGFGLYLWLGLRRKGAALVGMSILVAALSGTSSFVWFGLNLGIAAVILIEGMGPLLKREFPAQSFGWFVSLLVGNLLALPYLLVVSGRQESAFQIHISPTVTGWQYGGIFSDILGASPVTYTLDFIPQMAVEFGLVFVVGWLGWWALRRSWRENETLRLWTVLLAVFFLILLAVRPDRADSNNYAARVAPMAWLILAILGGHWWQIRQRKGWQIVLIPLLILGLLSTLYEPFIQQAPHYLTLLGFETEFQAKHPRYNSVSPEQHAIYDWLNTHTKPEAIYQIGWESEPATFFVERRAGTSAGYLALLYAARPSLYFYDERRGLETGFLATDAAHAAEGFGWVGVQYVVIAKDGLETPPLASREDAAFSEYFSLGYENTAYEIFEISGGD